MSTTPAGPTPAEQHLGDRLAALVDGELGHDARERVLAHLATCAKCKAEADAQRTLKSVFASTAPPPPSEGLLARLQGLPGGPGGPGGDDRRGGPFDDLFGLGPAGGVKSDGFATAAVSPHTGFRIHDVGRPDHDRSSWRGRRFGIAAASAVSFAAIALGGALPLESTVSAGARGEGTGSNVTPLRAAATGGGTGGLSGQGAGTGANVGTSTGRGQRSGDRAVSDTSGTPIGVGSTPGTVVPGPLVPGVATPAVAVRLQGPVPHSLLAFSPFIRPTGPALQLGLTPGASTFGGHATGPAPTQRTAPSSSAMPLTSQR
ncbi:zf-HC2 domain-containing protein [Streptomyces sp. ISL-36]|uniref:anti-sigma factor family protein n=1 Tax=Streptomyces sp. ISL-36 TaxID=2819182 RepID=UPI001BEB5C6E|nr:zf-HC2 domain-containing protein [Streptomyces sp. ISL-36]MBT2443293.1 zf-HC2 domain-containing protein [Streptomyces sp. ISL-36]